MTQNIYGLTRTTRPRRVQFILNGSKQFRKNGGPRPLLLRRPKVVFFGAQADFFFFFFFLAPSCYGVRRPNNFFDPPKNIFGPQIFFSPPNFFFRRLFFFPAPKTKNRLFRLRSNIFRRPSGKTSVLFFFRRRLVMVFGGQITFSIPPKYFSAAFFFFLGAPKNRRFLAPKTKNRLFRRASKEQRPKSCILGSTTIRASGGENCPSRFERVPGFSWNPSGGSTKASNEGFMKPP